MELRLDSITKGEVEWTTVLSEFWAPFSLNLENANTNMPKVRLSDKITTEVCPNCRDKYGMTRYLVVKNGRNGIFLSCPGFSDKINPCDFTKPYAIDIGVPCPMPDCSGSLVERMGNRGKVFYGCSNFPTCTFKPQNKRPLPDPCPECGGFATFYQTGKGRCVNRHTFDLETNDDDNGNDPG